MRSPVGEAKVDDTILRQSWMKFLPVQMATCLATSTNRASLDELPETADKIQELYAGSRICAVENPAPSPATPQQSDVLTRLLQKIESLCQTSPNLLAAAPQNPEIKSATITGHAEAAPRSVR
ncbi:unnamed protein product [Hymenolepis diminuta]|uniref:Uncharacterized protein n=1 Tax=Hymenolepis diminuta TaxID=6216 RepID=A0A564YFX9_HYMDI|nr:unnamed protein product [Hymenolepis diminuta]VUZ46106.1 unnamed protein product [Hymenolepis diminuta]VUZ56432.1 unnamed protein product [Hymenolepis diminuta]VUZ56433.1 unnamed protein product [Hymenolepis diminuta]